ncbi:hypothetical protein AAVH_28540 [Aphelenchoides avenae]|nr:hypothetical protein AAVH_28540 [Aphelenchus avenae]
MSFYSGFSAMKYQKVETRTPAKQAWTSDLSRDVEDPQQQRRQTWQPRSYVLFILVAAFMMALLLVMARLLLLPESG